MNGRLLGIDHGQKRIGIAISDALGIAARELEILQSRGPTEDFARIHAIAKREGALGIVVGVPLNPNAPANVPTQAHAVRQWIAQMRMAIPLPVAEVSEYLTSDEARKLAAARKRAPRDHIDDLAARIILQSFLDAQSSGSTTFPSSDICA